MPDPIVEAIHGKLPPAVALAPAVVGGVDPLTVVIDGIEHPATDWHGRGHLVGDRVLVVRGQGRLEIVGSSATRPTSATVVSIDGPLVTVIDAGGRTISGLPYQGAAPAVSAVVALHWGQDGGYVVGTLSAPVAPPPTTPAPADPEPPALPEQTVAGTVTAAATASATARSGAWRTDTTRAMQGHWTSGSTADNTGWYFHSRALTVAGATATDTGTVRLTRDSASGMSGPASIGLTLHAAHTKPGSPPALLAGPTVIGSLRHGQTDTFPLPAGWAQQLLDGTAGGVGVASPGTAHYAALTGPATDASAALISIPYVIGTAEPVLLELVPLRNPDLASGDIPAYVAWGASLPAGYRTGHTYGEPAGPTGLTSESLHVSDNTTWGVQAVLDFMAAGTSAAPVAEGTSYTASCWIQTDEGVGAQQSLARMGIAWYTAAGAALSVSWGAWTATVTDSKPWADTYGPWLGNKQASPAVTAAAPSNAAYGQPRVEVDTPDRVYYWAAFPSMRPS